MHETVLRGGTVVTPDGTIAASVAITDGRIAGLLDPDTDTEAEQVIDVTGKHVLPGGIDPHVHMMDPGDTEREDFITGTAAAAVGGITTVGDQHRHPKEGVLTPEVFEEKREYLADRARIDYGLMAGGHPGNIDHVAALEDAGALGFKSFTCEVHGVPPLQSDAMLELYRELVDIGGISMIHPEDELILNANKERIDAAGRTDGSILPDWHAKEAEQVAVSTTIEIADITGAPFWFAHLSHPKLVDMVTEAKEAGVDAYAETCVRYLYMTSDDLVERAPELWFTPPPRSEADREGLWERLASGEIDMVNADHAPAPPEMLDQPNENAIEAPFHNTSVEVLLPLLLEGVSEGRIGLPRVAEVFSTNPARITGLYPRKGAIRVGSDADLVIVDMDREVTLRDEDVVSKCGWTPYDGMTVQGVPEATYVRGELVVEDREVVGEPGYGEFVNPDHDTTPWAE